MVHIGNTPASNFISVTKDTFSGDGSTTAFTLSKAATTNGVAVFVENVRQEPTTAYSVSGTTLTFTAAPVSASGNNIYVLHHNTPASTATHPSAQGLTATSGTFSAGVSGTTGTFTGTVTAGSTLDMNGTELILDADADTSITADTDDQIDFKTGGSDRMSIGSDGHVTISNGNLIMYSGKGIDFSATSDSSGMTHEVLDDYEEGTWTPTLPSGGTVSSVGNARYTKIGRFVHVGAYFEMSAITNNTSTFYIGGLPYTVRPTAGYHCTSGVGYVASYDWAALDASDPLVLTNNTYIYFHVFDGSAAEIKQNAVQGLSQLIIAVGYDTDG